MPAHAQAFPTRPVRIIVPYTPGGGTDAVARGLAHQLQETWGQTVAAILVADRAPPPDDAELAHWIESRLAPHKWPRQIAFAPRLPQTVAGKLDRGALAALATGLRPLRMTSRRVPSGSAI